MSRLADSDLIILSAAAARDDGLAVVPTKMTKAVAAKVGSSLVARKLMREVKAKPGMPVWRSDEAGCSISLTITHAGQKAIGVEEADAIVVKISSANKPSEAKQTTARPPRRQSGKPVGHPDPIAPPGAGSKQSLVLKMLSAKSGATLDALIEATGWLPHTTRAALTGLRKKGFAIERLREKGASVYRIVSAASAKGA
jgi:hypothetical protein